MGNNNSYNRYGSSGSLKSGNSISSAVNTHAALDHEMEEKKKKKEVEEKLNKEVLDKMGSIETWIRDSQDSYERRLASYKQEIPDYDFSWFFLVFCDYEKKFNENYQKLGSNIEDALMEILDLYRQYAEKIDPALVLKMMDIICDALDYMEEQRYDREMKKEFTYEWRSDFNRIRNQLLDEKGSFETKLRSQ
jgi:hypothetical protein